MENDIRRIPRLQGWDDEKIYFIDKKNIEFCIHDNEEVYNILLKICITLFQIGSKDEIAIFIEENRTFLEDVFKEADKSEEDIDETN